MRHYGKKDVALGLGLVLLTSAPAALIALKVLVSSGIGSLNALPFKGVLVFWFLLGAPGISLIRKGLRSQALPQSVSTAQEPAPKSNEGTLSGRALELSEMSNERALVLAESYKSMFQTTQPCLALLSADAKFAREAIEETRGKVSGEQLSALEEAARVASEDSNCYLKALKEATDALVRDGKYGLVFAKEHFDRAVKLSEKLPLGFNPNGQYGDLSWIADTLVATRVVRCWKTAGGSMDKVDPLQFVEGVHASYDAMVPWKPEIGTTSIEGVPGAVIGNTKLAALMGPFEFQAWRAALERLKEFVSKWISGVAPLRKRSLMESLSKANTLGEVELAKMALSAHEEIVQRFTSLLAIYEDVDARRRLALSRWEKEVASLTTLEQSESKDVGAVSAMGGMKSASSVNDGSSSASLGYVVGAGASMFSEEVKNIAHAAPNHPIAVALAAQAQRHPFLAGAALGHLNSEGKKEREMEREQIRIFAENLSDRQRKTDEVNALVRSGKYKVVRQGYSGGAGYEWILWPRKW